MHCQKHDAKRRQLIKNLGDMKVKLDLVDLFCKKLKSESYQAFFFFLRQTNLFGGDLNYRFFKCFFYIYSFILFFLLFLSFLFFLHFGPRSTPNGGGNATFCCLPTPNK